MSKIKVVLFDLGSTLVYSKEPWPPFYERADHALAESLSASGIPIDKSAFQNDFGGFLGAYYESNSQETYEKTSFSLLKDLLSQKGFRNIPEKVLRAALAAMYSVTQQNWYMESDAISTLKSLKRSGYHLGVISNTSDDHNVQVIVDRCKLRSFFEIILTSASLGIRKPDPRIFKLALDHFQVQPDSAAMVGDLLKADILGANQSGIYSIWITRRVQLPGDGELLIQPQAVVTALNQLPDLLADLENYIEE